MAFFPDPPEEIFIMYMSLPRCVLPNEETVTSSGWSRAISNMNSSMTAALLYDVQLWL